MAAEQMNQLPLMNGPLAACKTSSLSSQFTTSPTSGRACTASGSGTRRPGPPGGTERRSGTDAGSYFLLPKVFPPAFVWPSGVFLLLKAVFLLRSDLTSRPWIQSSR